VTDRRLKLTSCYAPDCQERADQVDHVPARVFFPERKDAGRDLRRQLRTVPSCADHNQAFSDDERYAAYVLTGFKGVNDIGRTQRASKVSRTVDNDRRVRKELNDSIDWLLSEQGHGLLPTLNVQEDRLTRVFIKIACGMHYSLTGERLDGERVYYIGWPQRMRADLGAASNDEAAERVLTRLPFHPIAVAQPEVFACDGLKIVRGVTETVIFRLRFYGGVDVRVVTTPQFVASASWLGVRAGHVTSMATDARFEAIAPRR
jgi:hypothetical protein